MIAYICSLMNRSELDYRLALSLVHGIGSKRARRLVHLLGSAQAVMTSTAKALRQIENVGEVQAKAISSFDDWTQVDANLKAIQTNNWTVLCTADEDYPKRLLQVDVPPFLLYYDGAADLNAQRIISIVGTRSITKHGKAICERIVEELAAYDVTIISGLAYGVDVTAHRTSLKYGIPTIGCLGHGLDTIYPAAHKDIANDMRTQGGLLSRFPIQTRPDRERFPMRNELIAGMCDALLVIETATKGGSMITARMAIDRKRDLFAVPGRATDTYSAGCNLLIKEGHATLIESGYDMMSALGWKPSGEQSTEQATLFVDLDPTEQKIVDVLQEQKECAVDHLASQTGITSGRLAGILLSLELKGIVQPLPGSRYSLC